jgi:hypothetical protein
LSGGGWCTPSNRPPTPPQDGVGRHSRVIGGAAWLSHGDPCPSIDATGCRWSVFCRQTIQIRTYLRVRSGQFSLEPSSLLPLQADRLLNRPKRKPTTAGLSAAVESSGRGRSTLPKPMRSGSSPLLFRDSTHGPIFLSDRQIVKQQKLPCQAPFKNG